ncbi:MAG: class I adenylate-forming enzyme family protein [Elusimicrobiota bacterium]
MNFGQLLRTASTRYSERPFLLCPDVRLSYTFGDLDLLSRRAANRLHGEGLRPSDAVVLWLDAGADMLLWMLGAARLGAVSVPLSTDTDQSVAAAICRSFNAKACVLPKNVPLAELGQTAIPCIPAGDLPGSGRTPWACVAAGDPCFVFYTSGTTDDPKGVVHTQRSVGSILSAIGRHFALGAEHRVLSGIPWDNTFSLLSTLFAAYVHGGSVVVAPIFQPSTSEDVWRMMRRWHISSLFVTPHVARWLAERAPAQRLPALRWTASGCAPLHRELADEWESVVGTPLLNCYGSTETGFISSQSPNRRENGVGTPLSCEVRIDPGTREILVRGRNVMQGYYRNETLTRSILNHGWCRMGDMGHLDSRGFLHLDGRLKDVIMRNGLKLFPADIDSALMRHPAVLESATVAVPDPRMGEAALSVIVLKPGRCATTDELSAHCRRQLPRSRCPDRLRLTDALPRNARGKLLRKRLLDLFLSP